MTDLKVATLRLLEPSADLGAKQASEWLEQEGVEPLTDQAMEVRVGEILQVWKVRLRIWEANGSTVQGAPELLTRLALLDPESRIEQCSFRGPERSGNVFFQQGTHAFLGSVLY